jgi:glucose/arabinose dehydrogenase
VARRSVAFCSLPGSVVSTAKGLSTVPGGPAMPDLAWLQLPSGFCAHYFATVPAARQLKFAPNGDLFVASPSRATVGGAGNGLASVVVLPDDNHDGIADENITFLDALAATQGLMFASGHLYYQDDATIRRVPFRSGDRKPSGASELVTTITAPQSIARWPKVLDTAKDGAIYISNGGNQGESCSSKRTPFGGIFRLNADNSTSLVAMGFRNPIALGCEKDHDVCLAVELALDFSENQGGREKIVPVREGDDWGYPCCATRDLPYSGVVYAETNAAPDCSRVAAEDASFVIGHTPFGIDFETGKWPAPWAHRAFVTLHGDTSSWYGARVVALALDRTTGMPLPATDFDGGATDPENLLEFATGWDDTLQDHGRPAPVAFAPDGRLFLGDDQMGAVIWIAPNDLMKPR